LEEANRGLLVDLTGSYRPPVVAYGVSERLRVSRPAVVVDWEDFSPPPAQIGRGWWELLAEEAIRFGDVWICCAGGHGRTGTAAAILAYLLDREEVGDDPVTFIRKQYCDRAVETQDQIDYVSAITGTVTAAVPRWDHIIEYWGGD
jgi:protein-tyrosine phosphatase